MLQGTASTREILSSWRSRRLKISCARIQTRTHARQASACANTRVLYVTQPPPTRQENNSLLLLSFRRCSSIHGSNVDVPRHGSNGPPTKCLFSQLIYAFSTFPLSHRLLEANATREFEWHLCRVICNSVRTLWRVNRYHERRKRNVHAWEFHVHFF